MSQENAVVAIVIAAGTSLVYITKAIASAVLRYQENDLKHRPGSGLTVGADEERLRRIENAVESIAIEVERISEGQRYTTKLLNDRTGAGTAPPRTDQPRLKGAAAENA